MSENGWGQGWAPRGHSATGIAEALEGFARFGGRLYGARRWAQNPLTLTHVRWMGPRGEGADAVRQPGDDQGLGAEERDVWVELALGFPAMPPSPAGRDAPWLPLEVSPEQATSMVARLARALSAPSLGYDGRDSYDGYRHSPFGPGTPSPSPVRSGGPAPFPQPAYLPPVTSPGRDINRETSGGGAYVNDQGWNGDLRDAVLFDEGVSVIPSVEIELPMAMMGPAADSGRGFIRDIATAFVRAVQGLRQVREIRGWMRGGRLVLAVRLIIAPGSGAPTAEERDDALRLLAQVLAQHTLPYARIAMADPGEWPRGQQLTA